MITGSVPISVEQRDRTVPPNVLRCRRPKLLRAFLPLACLIAFTTSLPAGEDTLTHARQLVSAGLLSDRNGNYFAAVSQYTAALQIENKLANVRNREKAIAENNLALDLLAFSRLPEAEQLQNDAVTLFASDPVGADTPFFDALNNLATIQLRMEKLDAAEQTATKGLHLATVSISPESVQVAKFENTVGCLELHRKNRAASKQHLETALRIWIKTKGSDSTQYAATLTNLASLEDRAHHRKSAEA
ncbi:MAG: tetratricopeptide repeat protein, partial [Acidobacteriaceae bacterium]|nr:tetratricopeptide repeat protein [Acidobacteriaceae bacterium]